ncbi:MAG: hypothetical protein K2R98_22855 [Gemmataceae bacterium]|nr:hypothetical protein [Gemmataceae bacterium]
MNRQDFINRLVNRKVQSAGSARRAFCWNCICIASPKTRGQSGAGEDILGRSKAQPLK